MRYQEIIENEPSEEEIRFHLKLSAPGNHIYSEYMELCPKLKLLLQVGLIADVIFYLEDLLKTCDNCIDTCVDPDDERKRPYPNLVPLVRAFMTVQDKIKNDIIAVKASNDPF
jgi:hypothetical protein